MNNAIFVTETAKDVIRKINKNVFSSGQTKTVEHRRLSGNCETFHFISFHFITSFFYNRRWTRFEQIRQDYTRGEILTSELKKGLIELLTVLVVGYQEERKTDDVVKLYTSIEALKINYL